MAHTRRQSPHLSPGVARRQRTSHGQLTTSRDDRSCRPSPRRSAPPPLPLGWAEIAQAAHEAHAAAQSAGDARLSFLSAAEAADVEAVAAQIIPTDDTPGAREAGVVLLHRPGARDVSLAARQRLSRAARRLSGGVSRAASRRGIVRVAHVRAADRVSDRRSIARRSSTRRGC